MKRKTLRCFMSMVLVVGIFVTSVPIVNAAELKSPKTEQVNVVAQKLIQEDENLKVLEDDLCEELEVLENIGLEPAFIEKTESYVDDIVYIYDYSGGVVNKISVDMSDIGIVLNIQENNIYNKLQINDDGTVYIDGKRLETNNNSTDVEISPKSGEVMNWVVPDCPYDSKSSYTYLLGTKKDPDITLTAAISSLATSVVVAIICMELGVSAGLSTGVSYVVSWIKERNPSTRGLSYKATNYAHKNYTNTYITPIKKYAYRSDYTWYPNKNYAGSTYKQTLYHIKQIG